MGCDIHGLVEIREIDEWYDIFKADLLLLRNYDMFGCLFGVRNPANFKPLFADRGIPDDACDEMLEAKERLKINYPEIHSASYFTYNEITAVDSEVEAIDYDSRATLKTIAKDGTTELSKRYYDSLTVEEKKTTEKTKMKVKDILEAKDVKTFINVMKSLAEYYGGDNVRFCCYFVG